MAVIYPCDQCTEKFYSEDELNDHKWFKHSSNTKPKHQHQFTVPVEWADDILPEQYPRMVHKVTKLRCNGCTEEIER